MTTTAVFIGASNVRTGTWPERLCADLGWECHNFAASGGGISTGLFTGHLDRAIASTAFRNQDVDYLFIAGGGNDIRSGVSVEPRISALHAKALKHFPYARVISIPGLWGTGAAHPNLSRVVNEMRNAALAHGHEVIWQAWTWLMGRDASHMVPGDAVHPSYKGYTIFINQIKDYLKDSAMSVNHANQFTLGPNIQEHSRGHAQCICINGIVYLQGRFVKKDGSAFKLGDVVMTVPGWAAASIGGDPRPIAGALTSMDRHAGFYVYSDGTVKVRTADTGEKEVNIPATAWPVGM